VRCTCVTSKRAYLMHPENCFAVGDEVVSADARSLSCTRPSALQTTPAPYPVNWSFQERPEEFHERLRQIPMRWRSSLSSLMASMASGGSLDEHGRGAGSRSVRCGGTADMDIAGDGAGGGGGGGGGDGGGSERKVRWEFPTGGPGFQGGSGSGGHLAPSQRSCLLCCVCVGHPWTSGRLKAVCVLCLLP